MVVDGAGGLGDVGRSEGFEGSDCEVAEGGHDAGCVAGVDGGGVFGEGTVADVVLGFHNPVSAQVGGEFGRLRPVGVEAGDRVEGLAGLLPAGCLAAAVDAGGELRVREGDAAEVVGDGESLDRAGLATAVSLVRGGVLDGDCVPVQTVQLGPGVGLIGLDHGHVVRLLGLHQPGDIGLHGVQRVEGGHVFVQVERCEQGLEVPCLVGLGPDLGWARVTGRPWVTADSRCRRGPAQTGGAAQRLAVHGDHPSSARGCGGMAVGQPGSDGRIGCVGVEALEDPPDQRLGRRMPPAQQVTAHAERGEQSGVGTGAPLGELVEGPGSRDRGGRADQQDRGQ